MVPVPCCEGFVVLDWVVERAMLCAVLGPRTIWDGDVPVARLTILLN